MKSIGTKIGKNYAWELEGLFFRCNWKHGIAFFECNVTLNTYPCDHNPRFEFILRILNFTIVSFNVYNIWHEDNPNSPYFKKWLKEECKYHGEKYEE